MAKRRPLRIFVVEDEALLLMQLEALLVAAGHEVVATAMSTAEALARIPTLAADLAFVDLRLGDSGGGIVVGRQLARTARMPVIFVTANERRIPVDEEPGPPPPDAGDNDLGGDYAGAMGVIAKPYTLHGLRTALDFLDEALRLPPPHRAPPESLFLTPAYAARWQIAV
ncbi:response regulator [Methylobacterium planeticum]|uniref:Response regulator n=1 Tax=Methylobacterium planeticum TaxID=2615211 RepID=A0A6N6MQK3_9HYPH|nr:response regulator [Methylobacterium planeticum]KAB1073388.1 response regulator [Methylobacterium planeticum]